MVAVVMLVHVTPPSVLLKTLLLDVLLLDVIHKISALTKLTEMDNLVREVPDGKVSITHEIPPSIVLYNLRLVARYITSELLLHISNFLTRW